MDPQLLVVLVAIIGPAIALVSGLGGVALGQWMARKTAKQQIEAQDRRDALTRSREDTHRFTADKQVAYADFIAAFDRLLDAVADMMRNIADKLEEEELRTANRFDVETAHINIIELGAYVAEMRALRDGLLVLLIRVELLAREPIRAAADRAVKAALVGPALVVDSWNPDVATQHVTDAAQMRNSLMGLMRADLGELS